MFHGERALAGHHRGISQHVAIVRHVDIDESLRRPRDFPVTPIGVDRLDVRLDRLLPVAAADVDVGRHVNVVGEAGLKRAEAIRRSQRPLRDEAKLRSHE